VVVVTGRLDRVDAGERVVVLGATRVRVPDSVALAGLEPGTSVTVTCEERADGLWAIEVKRVRL